MRDSARLKLAVGKAKVDAAIKDGNGTAIYAAHLLPHLGHLLPTVLDAGVRMVEITSGSIWLDQHPPTIHVHEGGRYEARKWAHVVTTEELATRVRQLRGPLGDDVFLNVGAAGTSNSLGPARFTTDDAFLLSAAGADGFHVHLSNLEELKDLVEIAHENGLLVEAYISTFVSSTDQFSYMGIAAENPEEVAKAARAMEQIGVDIVGFMFSSDPMFYSHVGASETLPDDVANKLVSLRAAVSVPISVEGQITVSNAQQLREIGVDILVLGTHFDLAIENAIRGVVHQFSVQR
jgi:imidazole glycerol-phosphate synthase subunit HisF